jgi:hypothetical protein
MGATIDDAVDEVRPLNARMLDKFANDGWLSAVGNSSTMDVVS